MFWFKQKEIKEELVLPINGVPTKVFIYHENRRNNRVSIGKKGLHIRLSNQLSKNEKINQTNHFINWAKDQQKHQEVAQANRQLGYFNGRVFHLYDGDVSLQLLKITGHQAKAIANNGMVTITLPAELPKLEHDNTCSEFMTKILRKRYQKKIESKVQTFNARFEFGKVNQVRLKNNASNWGSCSSKGNINISVRLLLAPEDVVDYVILHELAHLQHPNHSKSFWNLVAKVCPDFKAHELWLKRNGHLCKI